MENAEKERLHRQLCAVLASIEDPQAISRLLEDLCTYTEIDQMGQRIECARLLMEGNTYSQIIEKTEISSATLSRVSRCLQRGAGGYRELLPPILSAGEGETEKKPEK